MPHLGRHRSRYRNWRSLLRGRGKPLVQCCLLHPTVLNINMGSSTFCKNTGILQYCAGLPPPTKTRLSQTIQTNKWSMIPQGVSGWVYRAITEAHSHFLKDSYWIWIPAYRMLLYSTNCVGGMSVVHAIVWLLLYI